MSEYTIPASLFNQLKQNKVDRLTINLTGGDDEGILNIEFQPWPEGDLVGWHLERIVTDWVYNNFEFSGAGDGTPYGTDYVYDLNKGTFTSQEWAMIVDSKDENEHKFEVVEEEKINE